VIRVERIKVRPRLLALLGGRAEPASIRLLGVRVEAGPSGRDLRELAARLRRAPPRRGGPPAAERAAAEDEPEPPSVVVRGLTVALSLGGRRVDVGPVDGTVRAERARGEERLRAELSFPGGASGHLDARRDGRGWRAEARVSGLGPEALPAALRDAPAALAGGELSVDATVVAAPDLGRAEGKARIAAAAVVLSGGRLAADPIGPIDAVAEGAFAWDGEGRRLALRDGRLALFGAVKLAVSGELRLGPGLPFALAARADALDFAAAVAALPAALAPPPDAPRPAGTLDAHLALSGPLLAPAAWAVDAGLDLSRLRESARRAPPVALREPFVHRPEVDRGAPPEILVGPRNPDFVPVAELPVHVVRAVTASEDAGFFAHEGFDFEELRNAFAQGAQAGRVVRGASTITQQLAKNLFLSREKTLARKVREAALTIALEATVPKQRLLEIYLNVAEWGPGLWGIGPAARHWFGKDARELTPREAVFLASVIPNPVRYHVMWERGATTEAWDQRVNEVLLKLTSQGVLTDDQLVAALDQPLVFARREAVAAP
jgi:hypothetical protein